MHRRSTARALVTLAALAAPALAATTPRVARAQSAEIEATRETLILQAQEARTRGDHRGALEAATQAGGIRMSPSVRLFIGQEQRETGNVTAALGTATLCLRELEGDTTVRNRDAIIAACRELEARARAEVAHLVVDVPAPRPPRLQVRVSGTVLAPGDLGFPQDVNPGAVIIEAEAEGMAPFRQRVDLLAGATLRAVVRLTPGGSRMTTGAARGPGARGPAPSAGAPVGPIVLLATGGALAVTGAVLFGVQASFNGSAACTEAASRAERGVWYCDTQADLDLARSADTLGTAGLALATTGVLAVGAGALWFALRPAPSAPPASAAPRDDDDDDDDAPPRRSARAPAPVQARPALGLGAAALQLRF